MRVAFVEPHLLRFGGVRRIIELANALGRRGHDVEILVPAHELPACRWLACTAVVRHLPERYLETYDIVVANDETQWHLLAMFVNARLRCFYYLHDASLYGKPGAWGAARVEADLVLANSRWTAERIAQVRGSLPAVLGGGVSWNLFYPVKGVEKCYDVLCVGDERPWKGTSIIEAAAARAGLRLEKYAPKGLRQDEMAQEYARARIFAVGSEAEGFGQPGLEALACGVPLVTTDNGGCREYARDEETALVVPPGDVEAMAHAFCRINHDDVLRERLVKNALELLAAEFSWDRAAAEFESMVTEHLEMDVPEKSVTATRPHQSANEPLLSCVVLAWNQLDYTRACVESIRRNTDVPYELIIVDNGSSAEAASFASQAADVAVLNASNLGFSRGMNQGLSAARGRFVAFINNDTELPSRWASQLLESMLISPRVGIVVPAVTAAGNSRTVRSHPEMSVETLRPFEAPPSAVIYVMTTAVASELGGWGEEYPVASAEDIDLCFKAWTNQLDIVFDARVLVDHVGKGTAVNLPDWREQWAANRRVFFEKWVRGGVVPVPRIESCPQDVFERNLAVAVSVATWMERYFRARSTMEFAPWRPLLRVARPLVASVAGWAYRRRDDPRLKRVASWVGTHPRLETALRRLRGA